MQEAASSYNGWKNWQTWNVALWFANDEGLYDSLTCHWSGCHEPGSWTPETAKIHVEDYLPHGTPDMDGKPQYDAVDWEAIAEAWNEE